MKTNLVPAQSSGNPFNELIPADKRKKVYASFQLVGIVLAAVVAGFAVTNGDDLPSWLVIVVVVWNVISSLGFTMAGSNVNPEPVATVSASPGEIEAALDYNNGK